MPLRSFAVCILCSPRLIEVLQRGSMLLLGETRIARWCCGDGRGFRSVFQIGPCLPKIDLAGCLSHPAVPARLVLNDAGKQQLEIDFPKQLSSSSAPASA